MKKLLLIILAMGAGYLAVWAGALFVRELLAPLFGRLPLALTVALGAVIVFMLRGAFNHSHPKHPPYS